MQLSPRIWKFISAGNLSWATSPPATPVDRPQETVALPGVHPAGDVSGSESVMDPIPAPEPLRPFPFPVPVTTSEFDKAERLVYLITNRQTPLGLALTYDPAMGFDYYFSTFLSHRAQLEGTVTRALSLLNTSIPLKSIQLVLQTMATEASQGGIVVAADEEIVAFKQKEAADRVVRVTAAIETNRAAQLKRKKELEEQAALGDLLAFFATAFAIASAVYTLGTSVVAVAAVPGLIQKVRTLADTPGPLITDFVDWDKEPPEPKPEVKELQKGWQAAFDASKKFYSDAEVVSRLGTATADESMNKLLAEGARLLGEKAEANLDVQQVALEMNVVQARKRAHEEVARLATGGSAGTGDTAAALAASCLAVVEQIHLYYDVVHRYLFSATRALRRWTFDASDAPPHFGYGWVRPDVEQALLERLAAGSDASGAVATMDAMAAYLHAAVASFARADWSTLRDTFERSIGGDDTDPLAFATMNRGLTATQLAELQETGKVVFALRKLPATVTREAHVEAVLAGVEPHLPNDLTITSRLDWTATTRAGSPASGRDVNRRSVIVPHVADRDLPALVANELRRLAGSGPSPSNALWGCSPLRQWVLLLSGTPAQRRKVTSVKLRFLVSGHAS